MKHILTFLLISALSAISAVNSSAELRALIVDGQNNHAVWPKSTLMMRQYLLDSGIFAEVDVARTRYLWKGEAHEDLLGEANTGVLATFEKQPKSDPDFAPEFSKYDLVVSNFGHNAANWPAGTRKAFEEYVAGGGGFVAVHAADNSFPLWTEYNRMIGIGGWGGRNEKSGPYVYINADGAIVRDTSPGGGGKHGPRNAFLITTRHDSHPITKGMPKTWLHDIDECYSYLRGPGRALTILATASDTEELQAAGRNEPMLMTIKYHEGRVFHTTLGHAEESFECVGFITTFQRGAQWAATGKVTIPIPDDFPGPDEVSSRPFVLGESKNPETTASPEPATPATPATTAEGTDLFADGDFSQWRTNKSEVIPQTWEFKDGVLHFKGRKGLKSVPGANLLTKEEYDNFELTFDWKISEAGNSGVKYRTNKSLGLEYQVLDDKNHPDGKKPNHRAGSLYDLVAAPDDKPINPVGKWNSSRIVADGNKIEHYLNGKKTAAVELGSPDWKERFGASKYKKIEGFGTHKGPLLLQDHVDEVWYRNVRIRRLE